VERGGERPLSEVYMYVFPQSSIIRGRPYPIEQREDDAMEWSVQGLFGWNGSVPVGP